MILERINKMEEIVLPFALASTNRTKAVSEATFTVQRDQAQFRSVTIARMRFMSVYEQERHNQTNFPFRNASQAEFKGDVASYRDSIAKGLVAQRNDISFGHPRTPHLKALDLLPHMIELEVVRQGRMNDRSTIFKSTQDEYQSTDPTHGRISEDNSKIQSMLIYDTNLIHGVYGGWEGTISCDMSNMGLARFRDGGNGNTFTIKASMYNYIGQSLGEMPSIQLSLLFR